MLIPRQEEISLFLAAFHPQHIARAAPHDVGMLRRSHIYNSVAQRTQRAQKGSLACSALNDPREWSVDGCRRDSVSAAELQRRVRKHAEQWAAKHPRRDNSRDAKESENFARAPELHVCVAGGGVGRPRAPIAQTAY